MHTVTRDIEAAVDGGTGILVTAATREFAGISNQFKLFTEASLVRDESAMRISNFALRLQTSFLEQGNSQRMRV